MKIIIKNKILGLIIIAVIAIVASYNIYISKNDVKLSDLALNNVEALASNNESGDNNCHRETLTWQCIAWAHGSLCYCGF